MSKKHNSQDEEGLFSDSMKGVKPLKSSNRVFNKPEAKKFKKRPKDEQDIDIPYIFHAPEVTGDEALSYARPNTDAKLLRTLKQGKYNIELSLDLHGFTIAEAEQELTAFMQYATMQQVKTLLIVHGKGRQKPDEAPKLKNLVNRFLLSLPNILAFCSAKAKDGGVGAVYVLLAKSE